VLLEKDVEDQLDISCEEVKQYLLQRDKEERFTSRTIKLVTLTGFVTSCVGTDH
jgi:hypothetical protein